RVPQSLRTGSGNIICCFYLGATTSLETVESLNLFRDLHWVLLGSLTRVHL
ncbi:LOW QUALITY PROTEIN: hypothetical protein PanWU01x14_165370, partial [Parasponia andersonii]